MVRISGLNNILATPRFKLTLDIISGKSNYLDYFKILIYIEELLKPPGPVTPLANEEIITSEYGFYRKTLTKSRLIKTISTH